MMERNNGKIIAIVALVVAVIGLSLGFAAFSTSLQISTAANVSTGTGNWNVGFSADGTTIADLTTATTKAATTSGNPGVLDITKYTISQNTNATLSTTFGSKVEYDFYVKNAGTATAYLDAVNFDNITVHCANPTATSSNWIEGSSNAGTLSSGANTSTITDTDCAKMFGVTLELHSTTYSATQTGITGKSIAGGANTPAKLTVSYLGTSGGNGEADTIAATLDGDIVVSIGTIAVEYKSTPNS